MAERFDFILIFISFFYSLCHLISAFIHLSLRCICCSIEFYQENNELKKHSQNIENLLTDSSLILGEVKFGSSIFGQVFQVR